MADLSIHRLFELAFGKKFEPQFETVFGNSFGQRLEKSALPGAAPYYAFDANGREYFMPVKVKYASSVGTASGNFGVGVDVSRYESFDLPYPCIAINSRKLIVETPLTERRGTVKEVINVQDYQITIKGVAIIKDNDFPEQWVARLRDLYESSQPISIECALTDIFLLRRDRTGSDNVVITRIDFPEMRGVKHAVAYQIDCVSDAPFELVSIEQP